MRKKTITILLAIATIIYIIIGAFLFLNIQIMETPEIIIKIEVTELSSEEAILHTSIDIYNPNGFEIIVKNLEVVTTTPDGYEVSRVLIKGGEISHHEKKTFSNDVIIAFNGNNPELLTSKITGEVGANILFIKKTIPLNIGVVTSIENLINKLAAPIVSIAVDFLEITTDGINITAIMDIYNPNSFDIFIKDIFMDIRNEEGKKIGDVGISEGVIESKDYLLLNSNGTILLEALNAEILILNLSWIAGVKIAGFEKNLSFNIQTRIVVPDFEELILSKEVPIFLSIKLDEKFTLRGIIFYIGLEINNSYKVDLVVKNLIFKIYTVADDTNRLIGENDKLDEILVKAGSSELSSCEILVPYSKILSFDGSIDWMMASVTGSVSIKGVNQSVFLEIRGYHSLHPFR